eukprot:scaffold3715_cov58-Phaeocystis_antarctica.AAC.4
MAAAAGMAARAARAAQAGGWSLCTPRGEALWRRGRVVGGNAGLVATVPIPIEIAGCGRARRVGVQDPAGGAPAAAVTGRVPVQPEGSAVRFVVRCPGGRGALHGVGESCRAACCAAKPGAAAAARAARVARTDHAATRVLRAARVAIPAGAAMAATMAASAAAVPTVAGMEAEREGAVKTSRSSQCSRSLEPRARYTAAGRSGRHTSSRCIPCRSSAAAVAARAARPVAVKGLRDSCSRNSPSSMGQ